MFEPSLWLARRTTTRQKSIDFAALLIPVGYTEQSTRQPRHRHTVTPRDYVLLQITNTVFFPFNYHL